MRRVLMHRLAKPVVWLLCLAPLGWLVMRAFNDMLGANPAERVIRETGEWTLRWLCVVLAVTPLRQWSGEAAWARFRRLLGLWTFAYACVHLSAYAVLDQGLDGAAIGRDIAKRPFILVGFLAWVVLVPLALTSVNRVIKAMGAARWKVLHRGVYAVALLGVLHFFWVRASKHRWEAVAVYAAIIGVLLGWRGVQALRRRHRSLLA